jgi:hypothetical protein
VQAVNDRFAMGRPLLLPLGEQRHRLSQRRQLGEHRGLPVTPLSHGLVLVGRLRRVHRAVAGGRLHPYAPRSSSRIGQIASARAESRWHSLRTLYRNLSADSTVGKGPDTTSEFSVRNG